MLKVGTQNQAKTLKVNAWPDGAKTLKVPARSETVPRPYGEWGGGAVVSGSRSMSSPLGGGMKFIIMYSTKGVCTARTVYERLTKFISAAFGTKDTIFARTQWR